MMDLLVDDKPFSSSPLRDDKASSDTYSETFLDVSLKFYTITS